MTTDREIALAHIAPAMEVAFPLEEYRARLARVRAAMAARGIATLFVSAPENIFYLSGMQAEWYQTNGPRSWQPASGIAVHVDADDYIHFEREHETALVKYSTVSRDVRIPGHAQRWGLMGFIVQELKGEGWLAGKVGLEMSAYRPDRATSEEFQALLEVEGARVVDAGGLIEEVRRIKSPLERAYTRTAARIGDIGMKAAIEALPPGVTELDVYGEIVAAMAHAGGENPGITMPVNSGAKSTASHGLASRKKILPGEVVHIDLCGVFHRYHSNLSRTLCLGEPSRTVIERVALSAGSFDVLSGILRPGIAMAEVFAEMTRYYKDQGIWDEQRWIGGYELGIAFPPDWVGPTYLDVNSDLGDRCFEAGMVGNYESQFFLPEGAGASVLIDTMLFDEHRAELLHRVPREILICG
jgi:Xaa-Pro dipeptidase